MASTLNGTGITFSDGTTQNSGSAFAAIGTISRMFCTSSSQQYPNTTVSGSLLHYYTSNASAEVQQNWAMMYPPGNRINGSYSGTVYNGYDSSSTRQATYTSGTWRCIGQQGTPEYSSYWNKTGIQQGLFVRVS